MSKVVFCQRLWQMEMASEQEWNPPHPSQISQGIDLFVLLYCSAASTRPMTFVLGQQKSNAFQGD